MRNSPKASYIDWLCTNFASVNIVMFVASELVAAIAALFGIPTAWRRMNEDGVSGDPGETARGFVYRSAEMERRRTGVSDRRRSISAPSKRLPAPGKAERRMKPERRAAHWGLHPA